MIYWLRISYNTGYSSSMLWLKDETLLHQGLLRTYLEMCGWF